MSRGRDKVESVSTPALTLEGAEDRRRATEIRSAHRRMVSRRARLFPSVAFLMLAYEAASSLRRTYTCASPKVSRTAHGMLSPRHW